MVGGIGGVLTVPDILGISPSLTLPIGLGIMFVALSVAQFLAFHDLRGKKDKKEWEFIRQKKIELASKQLDGLYNTLQAMREKLRSFVNEASSKTIAQDVLDRIHPYMHKEYPNFYARQEHTSHEEEVKYFMDFATLMDTLGIGFEVVPEIWTGG